MGTEMEAFIEYDKSEYYRKRQQSGKSEMPPFTEDIYSISRTGGIFTGSKDYLFFAAIAGVRNDIKKEPLIKPRGLPDNTSIVLKDAIKKGFDELYSISYLTLTEVNEALKHFCISNDDLSFESNSILNIMGDLEKRLGENRVRLVFGFE